MLERSPLLEVQDSHLMVLQERLALLDSAISALEQYRDQVRAAEGGERNPACLAPPAFSGCYRRA